MKNRYLIALGLAITTALAYAAQPTFNLYSPAAGIQKNTGATYSNTAAASTDVRGLWSGTCDSTTYLRGDGSCQTPPGTGGGTVDSVGLSAPSVFSVAGSPVTSTGTLALSFATGQTANRILATPDGTTGALSLRALVAADLPAVPLATGVSGTLPVANGGTGVTSLGALSRTNDTNVTLTLGGSPSTALVNAASLTLGWTGNLAVARGGTGAATLSGLLRGNGTSAIGAAANTDVIGLWTGTCNSGTFLRGDGSCNTVTASPGGSTTQVQYNSGGSFAGDAAMTWNAGTATLSATNFSGNGTSLTGLVATNISSGTVADARLSSNVPLKNAANVFTAANHFSNGGTNGGYLVPDASGLGIGYSSNYSAGGAVYVKSGGIDFYRAGTVAAAMNTSGNWTINAPSSGIALGITNAPGDYALTATDGTSTFGLYNNTSGGTRTGTNSNHPLTFYTNGAGNDRMSIAAAGNVTINAPSSGVALGITGVASQYAIHGAVSGGAAGGLYLDGGAAYLMASTNTPLYLGANNTPQVTITPGGGARIGSPTGGDLGAGTLNTAGDIAINNVSVCREDGTNCDDSINATSVTATTGTFTSATVGGSNVCRADGTNCPGSSSLKALAGECHFATDTCTTVYAASGVSFSSPSFNESTGVWTITVNGFSTAYRCTANGEGGSLPTWLPVASVVVSGSTLTVNMTKSDGTGVAVSDAILTCMGT